MCPRFQRMPGDGYGQMMTEKEFTMKTILKKGVILLVLVSQLFFAAPIALADGPINNQIKGSGASASQPSSAQNLFYTASNARKIERPSGYDFFSTPFAMYVNAPKGHSVYVYDYWSFNDANRFDAAFHGSRVIVLAEHGEFYCILYHTQSNELKVAWVNAENLVSYYPGNTAQLGWGRSSTRLTNVGDPVVSWSRENFIGTKRKYTVLNQSIYNVASFTLDYQVTARNGSESYEVTGPRDVYVNDGSGWVYVGSFDYPDHHTPIHVTINLDQPMTLAAVATAPNCADPNTFVFRQSVLDVMCA